MHFPWLALRHELQLILKQSLIHKKTDLSNPCSYTHSPWSSSSLTSTLGLKQEKDFTFPRSWDMPKQPGPAGCLPHPKPTPETLFSGTVSSRGFQATLGGGSDPHPQLPVLTFLSPSHSGKSLGSPLPSSLHSIQGDPKQVGRAGISSNGIHTHLGKIPLPE